MENEVIEIKETIKVKGFESILAEIFSIKAAIITHSELTLDEEQKKIYNKLLHKNYQKIVLDFYKGSPEIFGNKNPFSEEQVKKIESQEYL